MLEASGTGALVSELTSEAQRTSITVPTTDNQSRTFSWLIWLAAACGIVGQLLFSNDWCLYAIPAALLAALVFWIVIALISRMTRSGKLPQWQYGLVLAVAIGLCSGAAFRVRPSWAFREVFGVEQPRGIHDLRIWRHYEGGPGEHTLILEFRADEAAVIALTASIPRQPNPPPGAPDLSKLEQEWYENRSWIAAYELFGGAFHSNGRKTWERILPLREPQVYYRELSPTTEAKSTLLMWEPESGRVVVLHSRG